MARCRSAGCLPRHVAGTESLPAHTAFALREMAIPPPREFGTKCWAYLRLGGRACRTARSSRRPRGPQHTTRCDRLSATLCANWGLAVGRLQACLSTNVGALTVIELAPIKRPGCLGLLNPRIAPALACDLLTRKQGAASPLVCGLALVERTVATKLTICVLGKLFRVRFGGVFNIAKRNSRWVFFSEIFLGLRRSCKHRAAGSQGHKKLTSGVVHGYILSG